MERLGMKIKLGFSNSSLICYAVSICITIAALLLHQAVVKLVGGNLPTYIFFYPAVIIAALFAGFRFGLLVTAMAALLADYWIISPKGFAISSLSDAVGLAIFSFNGVLISVIAELYRRARTKTENYAAQLALRDSRRREEEVIHRMAYHDSLTGLPNRKLFSDRLGIALAHARRNQNKVAVAMIDLDNFKEINDTLGHIVGDLFLKATAERLDEEMRKADTVARFGGDEFLLILPDLMVIEDAIPVAQKIVDSFCKPILVDTYQFVVTMSIGIAVYPHDGTDEVILLKNADIAMYLAKQAGGGRYQLYKEA
ncbi:MAG: diguanylate cyclase [Smithella sp.]